jgi:hypothetical protein
VNWLRRIRRTLQHCFHALNIGRRHFPGSGFVRWLSCRHSRWWPGRFPWRFLDFWRWPFLPCVLARDPEADCALKGFADQSKKISGGIVYLARRATHAPFCQPCFYLQAQTG